MTDRAHQDEWLSITRYARVYGISRQTVYKYLQAGLLVTYRVGTLIRIKHVPPDPSGRATLAGGVRPRV